MAGAAFSPTHWASLRSSGTATSSLSKRLSTAIRGWELDLGSISPDVLGVAMWSEVDWVSGEPDDGGRREGTVCRGESDAKPPSRYSAASNGWTVGAVLPWACDRAVSS